MLNPILAAIPLQLLAYCIAVCQGRQVDHAQDYPVGILHGNEHSKEWDSSQE